MPNYKVIYNISNPYIPPEKSFTQREYNFFARSEDSAKGIAAALCKILKFDYEKDTQISIESLINLDTPPK